MKPDINIEAIPDLIDLALTCECCHKQAQKAAEEYEQLLNAIRIIGRAVGAEKGEHPFAGQPYASAPPKLKEG